IALLCPHTGSGMAAIGGAADQNEMRVRLVPISLVALIVWVGSATAEPVQPARADGARRGATRSLTEAARRVALARQLLPVSTRGSVDKGDLSVERCGIFPTYPCISAFFTWPGSATARSRLRILRAQARRSGWRVMRLRPFGTGLALELARVP